MSASTGGHTSVHFFNGGCGSLRGFTGAGLTPLFGANHHPASVKTARLNWPGLYVREAEVQNLDMNSVPAADVLEASPICTEAAPSGGKSAPRKPVQLDAFGRVVGMTEWPMTRVTMFEPIRYASVHRPMVYAGENVPEFGFSPLFRPWVKFWEGIDYTAVVASVNAAHLRVNGVEPLPQSRNRMVWAFVRNDVVAENGLPDLNPTCAAVCQGCGPVQGIQFWKEEPEFRIGSYGRRRQYIYVCPACGDEVDPVTRGIDSVIESDVRGEPFGLGYLRSPNGKKRTPYRQGTRDRVAAGLERYRGEPFIVTLRNHCDASPLSEPIGTLSAQGGGHHYLARPTEEMTVDSVEYRPLTNLEKARCQGFPDEHVFAGTPADRRLQIGNAVPVNVATWQAGSIRSVLPPHRASLGAVDLRVLRPVPDSEAAA
ncbi:DNA cytosine methyltransferase [Streptomyces africanus]|uniref:DNA cytosine methyltransferase n=1 Tax=Streptomyces africanus TaxID=231024 RepID=UPI000A3A7430|nr:DNA cytosine methyltransferase [Streptomyces africanus]